MSLNDKGDSKMVILNEALASLRWSAGGEWSARITPPQAQALLAELDRLTTVQEIAKAGREARTAQFNSAVATPADYGLHSA